MDRGAIVMILRFLPFCATGLLLAGCATGPGPAVSTAAAQDNIAVPGYHYHDGNHPNGVSQPSPQAIYNATHGTWLWPPVENIRRD
jgi:hypothetical protein